MQHDTANIMDIHYGAAQNICLHYQIWRLMETLQKPSCT
jgi:hypothetical protein